MKAGQAPRTGSSPAHILLADRQGTRLAIRENQNPSPRWARRAVVQVFTRLVKLSVLFCGNVFFLCHVVAGTSIQLDSSQDDCPEARAPSCHQLTAPFLQSLGPRVMRFLKD